ncbi:zinc metalloproteinase nas-6-like [Porites lutea]|uniref:zinc metalloproteinase nas-6-like n=1 Tax=Porites lutea TaxID=51062 RepID=UPI003CC69320
MHGAMDKITGKNSTKNRQKRNFFPPKRYRWNPDAIPYMLDKSLGVVGRKAFQAAVTDFEKYTCIRFIKHTNEKAYIWVHRGSGCFSATGKSGGKQPLSLGNGCTSKGVVIHELLHALGMMHEHCRADRDQFIRINFNNVRPKAKIEFQILKGYVLGEPYDFGSVTHYGFDFFSINPTIPTIVKLMPGGAQIGQREGFSPLDLRKINKFYNCKNYIKPVFTPEEKKLKIVSGNCNFEKGFCSWRNWKNKVDDQFDWEIGMANDPHPPAGKTYGQPFNLSQGKFIFFEPPKSYAEYISSGVLYSGFFNGSSCLRFYYHMSTGGCLRVFTKEKDSKRKNPYVLIWEKIGPQGNKWKKMKTSISGKDKLHEIYIEGIKTPDQMGFVAFDEVHLTQGRTCG